MIHVKTAQQKNRKAHHKQLASERRKKIFTSTVLLVGAGFSLTMAILIAYFMEPTISNIVPYIVFIIGFTSGAVLNAIIAIKDLRKSKKR